MTIRMVDTPSLGVVPEHIGTGIGGELFLHACETAETVELTN
jgi:predicted N-acetyltransferase YhbS